METIEKQIDLFLIKSVFGSISSVEHHNEMYQHGKDILRIHEEIDSLTDGLKALRSLEKEQIKAIKHEEKNNLEEAKKQRATKLQQAVTLFGLLSVFSAISAAKTVSSFFGEFNELAFAIFFAIIVIVVVKLFCSLKKAMNVNKKDSE